MAGKGKKSKQQSPTARNRHGTAVSIPAEEAANVQRIRDRLPPLRPVAADGSPASPESIIMPVEVVPPPQPKEQKYELVRRLGVIGTALEDRFTALYEELADILPGGAAVLRPLGELGLAMLSDHAVRKIGLEHKIRYVEVLTQARAAIADTADRTMYTTVMGAGGMEARLSSSLGYKDVGIRIRGNQFMHEGKRIDSFVGEKLPTRNIKHRRDYMLRLADAPEGVRFLADSFEPACDAIVRAFPVGTPLEFDTIPPLPPINSR